MDTADFDVRIDWSVPDPEAELHEGLLERTHPLTLRLVASASAAKIQMAPRLEAQPLTASAKAPAAVLYEAPALAAETLSSTSRPGSMTARRVTEDFRVVAQNGDEVQLAWDSPHKGIFA
jgi:hypothetical protein